MGKEKSTAKIASSATRHNPMRRAVSGSQFFPSSFDNALDHQSDSADTPTPTSTPLPTSLQNTSPAVPSTRDKTPTPVTQPGPDQSARTDDPMAPAPRTPPPSTPALPSPVPTPSFTTSDRDLIASFLEVTERNRSMISTSASVAKTKLAKFTPAPEKGFPVIHLASPGQLLADLNGPALAEWLNVNNPKLVVRIFDYDGGDPTKMNPVITHRVRDVVNEISVAYNARDRDCTVSPPTPALGYPVGTSPNVFLVHNITDEIRDVLISQRVWSSATITFEARPLVERALPTLLLTLAGFTTNRPEIVREVVQNTWSDPEVRDTILTILHDKDVFYKREDVMAQAVYYTNKFTASIQVEFLDYKVAGGIETPRFNIYADSPTANPDAWTAMREFLMSLYYPTSLYGTGTANRLFLCTLCHSVSHPRGLCEYPNTPLWNGPVIEMKLKGHQKNKNNAAKGKRL